MAPVPPLPTATVPFTLAALPAILPETFPPEIPEIFTSVMAASAMSTVAMLWSKIFALLMAPVAIV